MTKDTARLNAFPVFMRVEGEAVVIVGNGEEALAKARLLGQSSARLRVVSEAPEAELHSWISANGAEHIAAAYDPSHLAGAVLVFAATGDAALDRRISDDARAQNIPVNAVDRPELCDFFTPALVNRAPLAIAIGTEGAGPVLAQIVRAKIDRLLSPSLGALGRPCQFAARYRREAAAEGQRAPPLLERFLHWRAGPRHGDRPCIGGSSGCLRIAAAQRASPRPYRACRRGSGCGRPSDPARPSPADGSRRHRSRRAGAGGGRRHGPA